MPTVDGNLFQYEDWSKAIFRPANNPMVLSPLLTLCRFYGECVGSFRNVLLEGTKTHSFFHDERTGGEWKWHNGDTSVMERWLGKILEWACASADGDTTRECQGHSPWDIQIRDLFNIQAHDAGCNPDEHLTSGTCTYATMQWAHTQVTHGS